MSLDHTDGDSGGVASGIGDRARHGYETARPDIAAHVPGSVRRILELGCSEGALGAALKQRQRALIVGVEVDPAYASVAEARLDRVVASDIDTFLHQCVPPEAPFDCLVAADVLEHLVDPWQALERAVALLQPGATVVISVPNVAEWRGLLRMLRSGRWPRDDEGVFDRTHLRWFTFQDALDLLRGAGLIISTVEPRYWVGGWKLRLFVKLTRTGLHRFLASQYIISAVKDS